MAEKTLVVKTILPFALTLLTLHCPVTKTPVGGNQAVFFDHRISGLWLVEQPKSDKPFAETSYLLVAGVTKNAGFIAQEILATPQGHLNIKDAVKTQKGARRIQPFVITSKVAGVNFISYDIAATAAETDPGMYFGFMAYTIEGDTLILREIDSMPLYAALCGKAAECHKGPTTIPTFRMQEFKTDGPEFEAYVKDALQKNTLYTKEKITRLKRVNFNGEKK